MNKINKIDLINDVAEKAHLSKRDSKAAIDSLFFFLSNYLKSDNTVNISGFGVFSPLTRKSRKGTNPKSHDNITISETKSVSFKLAKNLKEEFNK